MGSIDNNNNNKNPWSNSEIYRDCSQGICSIYCPQWCTYIFFSPPPSLLQPSDDSSSSSSSTPFSPLIISIIGLLASGFILISYYLIIAKYCRRRRNRNSITEIETNHDHDHQNHIVGSSTGLDEMIIKTITVCKYKKGEGLIEGTECAVCLNEFQENENLRLLPKCTHAFHLPCIDTWLKTHSNCPLCRSTAAPANHPPPAPAPAPPPDQNSPQASLTLNVSSLELQRQSDLVLVVEDRARRNRDEVVVSLFTGEFLKDHIHGNSDVENPEIRNNLAEIDDQEGVKHFRRSISLGTFSCQRNLSIADILKIDEDGEIVGEISGSAKEIGSSNSSSRDLESTTHDKGKNSMIPH